MLLGFAGCERTNPRARGQNRLTGSKLVTWDAQQVTGQPMLIAELLPRVDPVVGFSNYLISLALDARFEGRRA